MLKKMLPYLYFLPYQRRAIAVLMAMVGILYAAPEVMRHFRPAPQTDFATVERHIAQWRAQGQADVVADVKEVPAELFYFDPNTASVETLVRLGVPPRVAQTIQRYRERGGRFRTPDDLGKIYTLPAEVFERLRPYVRIGQEQNTASSYADKSPRRPSAENFPFDPNTATKEDLLRLGLPPALVERLLRYREKGGIFRQKSDFRKLYGLSDADYERLEPYITITPPAEVAALPATYSGGSERKALQRTPIDINTADAERWMSLPGIGEYRAKKILQHRERLGGFHSVEQVGETFGLPDSIFQQIKPWLRIETPVYKKINLNATRIEDLADHPYINYAQARIIIAYREQHGRYKTPEDVRRALHLVVEPEWFARVLPYLDVN